MVGMSSFLKKIGRGCSISPDCFCYICGDCTIKSQRRKISDFVKKAYFNYFKMKLGDQNKPWARHKVCKTCEETLRLWFKSYKKSFCFGILMTRREHSNHTDNYYFCSVSITGFNRRNKKDISYPMTKSAIHLVFHNLEIPVPIPPDNLNELIESDAEGNEIPEKEDSVLFSQGELNDLIRDLGLTKDKAELLGS